MATFVLIPGAWLGAWCWRDVVSGLQSHGHRVFALTLSGLADLSHLLDRETSLHTHVTDVVSFLDGRNLQRVMLVGHSYGGTVITAAAERAASRIGCLVYLDASVPLHGQSNNDVLGTEWAAKLRAEATDSGDGWLVPPASIDRWGLSEATRMRVAPHLTPHPLRSFEEPVQLHSTAAAALPRAFVRSSAGVPLYSELLARARGAGWRCTEIGGGHYAMLTQAQAVTDALHRLAQGNP